ncbi:MAG: hypothetical protein LBJ21_05925, partial [Acidobacteriota bacterium]|nr:hypothetical protein [Acidobacteriota bacterium]
MKKTVWIALVLFAATPLFTQVFAQDNVKNYIREWEQIDSLLKQRQPQSAEKIIDGIYREALAQNNVAQLIKAHLYRASSISLREEESLVRLIAGTEEAIAKTQAPAGNILHSIAAEFYWRYYEQNRWRFHNRTATETAETITGDMRTWDLRRLVEKCVEHFSASLMDPGLLQKTAIEPFGAMLERQAGSEKYRPTLFDFLAFRAVEFFGQNIVNLLQPAEPFLVNDPRYFAPAGDFSKLAINTSDSLSFKFRALTLLQEIIAFHIDDPDPAAFIDADLHRLDFVFRYSTLPEKEQLYIDALRELDMRYAYHSASTEILFRVARTYKQQGDTFHPFTNPAAQWKKQEAIEIIEQAVARFPGSFGAENCLALRDEIKQPGAQLTADNTALPGKPVLVSVRYWNISALYYKIVPVDFKQSLNLRENDENRINSYAGIDPVHTGQWTLPGHEDYQTHNIEMALPELTEGYYAILASDSPDFPPYSLIIEKLIWVSKLSYVWQNIPGSAASVLVLDRETGKPVSGVSMQEYSREYNPDKRRYESRFGNTYRSDAQGLIRPRMGKDYRYINFYLTNGNDQYASGDDLIIYPNNSEERPSVNTTIFSDRAIY